MLNNITQMPREGDDPLVPPEVFQSMENFVASEASNVGRPGTLEEIKAACAECKAYGAGQGHFDRQWDERIVQLLGPSYKALQLIGDDPHRLVYLISESGVEATKATRKNPALVCVKITARPRNTAEMKLCSTWAVILNEAHAENISVERFAEWVKGREKRVTPAAMADKRPELSGTVETSRSKLGQETLSLLASVHPEVREAVEMPGSDIDRLQRVIESLQARLDDLKATQDGVGASKPLFSEYDASATTTEVADV